MYDVSNRDSFTCLETWINELNRYSTKPNIIKMVVGNKIDQVRIFITFNLLDKLLIIKCLNSIQTHKGFKLSLIQLL